MSTLNERAEELHTLLGTKFEEAIRDLRFCEKDAEAEEIGALWRARKWAEAALLVGGTAPKLAAEFFEFEEQIRAHEEAHAAVQAGVEAFLAPIHGMRIRHAVEAAVSVGERCPSALWAAFEVSYVGTHGLLADTARSAFRGMVTIQLWNRGIERKG